MTKDTIIPNKNSLSGVRQSAADSHMSNPVTDPVTASPYYQTKPVTVREMVVRRINKTLGFCLIATIVVTFISYYIAMNYEAKLNALDREIVKINTENLDLQADLDRYKSFNNVDSKIGEFKLLQKADKVLEVTAMNTAEVVPHAQKVQQSAFNWAIGY